MKKVKINLIAISVFLSLISYSKSLSQVPEESVTINTYFPAPYGAYNQVEVYRSITYKPVDKDNLPGGPKEGELVYNASDRKFYYYNGEDWVLLG